MGLLSAMTVITKNKALIGKHVKNSSFSEITSLTSKAISLPIPNAM